MPGHGASEGVRTINSLNGAGGRANTRVFLINEFIYTGFGLNPGVTDSLSVIGEYAPRGGNRIEQAVTDYPGYLTEPANRICEPAGAMNVLTVGALAHGEGLGPEFADDVHRTNEVVHLVMSAQRFIHVA